jgi:hypothetical protein
MSAELKRRYMPRIEHLLSHPRRGWSLKHVTLTTSIELTADVGQAAVDLLNTARDTYYSLWGKHDGAGALATLEVGPGGEARQLHIHLLVWGPYYWHSQISQEWERRTGFPVVWVQRVEDPERAAKEVLKYVTKAAGLSPGELVDLYSALHGKRRLRAWGAFYDVSLSDDEEGPRNCPECGGRLSSMSSAAVRQLMDDYQTDAITALCRWEGLDLIPVNNSKTRAPPIVNAQPSTNPLVEWNRTVDAHRAAQQPKPKNSETTGPEPGKQAAAAGRVEAYQLALTARDRVYGRAAQ